MLIHPLELVEPPHRGCPGVARARAPREGELTTPGRSLCIPGGLLGPIWIPVLALDHRVPWSRRDGFRTGVGRESAEAGGEGRLGVSDRCGPYLGPWVSVPDSTEWGNTPEGVRRRSEHPLGVSEAIPWKIGKIYKPFSVPFTPFPFLHSGIESAALVFASGGWEAELAGEEEAAGVAVPGAGESLVEFELGLASLGLWPGEWWEGVLDAPLDAR